MEIAKEGEEAFVEFILKDQPEPPLYFARMKALNRDGVPLLDHLPEPRRLCAQELGQAVAEKRLVPIDTRDDKLEFLEKHLPGSLFIPFHSNFCTTAGSLLDDEKAPLLLIVNPEYQEETIRRLIRIGFDNIEAVASLDTQRRYFSNGGSSDSIPVIDFSEAESMKNEGAALVDLRYKSEYEQGHIPGAIHVPYTRLPEMHSAIPSKGSVAAHCHTGLRAAVSSAYLKRQGYDVYAVNDNIKKYLRSV